MARLHHRSRSTLCGRTYRAFLRFSCNFWPSNRTRTTVASGCRAKPLAFASCWLPNAPRTMWCHTCCHSWAQTSPTRTGVIGMRRVSLFVRILLLTIIRYQGLHTDSLSSTILKLHYPVMSNHFLHSLGNYTRRAIFPATCKTNQSIKRRLS